MAGYQIILKNEKLRLYRIISWIFIIIHILAFLFSTIYSEGRYDRLAAGAGATGLLTGIIVMYVFRSRERKFALRFLFIICWVTWLAMGNYWLVPIPILFDLLYYASTQPMITRFSERNIIYPSFPSRKIEWSQVSNVVLRDGLLTIDLKNNRLIQQEVDPGRTPVNEEEFNEFCRSQVNK